MQSDHVEAMPDATRHSFTSLGEALAAEESLLSTDAPEPHAETETVSTTESTLGVEVAQDAFAADELLLSSDAPEPRAGAETQLPIESILSATEMDSPMVSPSDAGSDLGDAFLPLVIVPGPQAPQPAESNESTTFFF